MPFFNNNTRIYFGSVDESYVDVIESLEEIEEMLNGKAS